MTPRRKGMVDLKVYNEVYVNSAYFQELEDALKGLMKTHPEWGIDFCEGENNWEPADLDVIDEGRNE